MTCTSKKPSRAFFYFLFEERASADIRTKAEVIRIASIRLKNGRTEPGTSHSPIARRTKRTTSAAVVWNSNRFRKINDLIGIANMRKILRLRSG